MSDRIKVAIRVRPLIEREELEGLFMQWEVKNNSIFQKDSGGKCYSFDHVFDITTKNYDVFNSIARPIIDSSVAGFNGTIFAYGQTSSGKTHTMMGSQDDPGIIPMTIHYIFEALNQVQGREFLLRASYIEIYNEKVNDLLEKGKTGLKLCEVEGNVFISGLKEEVVHTPDKIMQLMKRGENIRHIGETNMNEISSRSHAIFRIIIESRVPHEGEDGAVQVSHLNMVDLAGSERVDQIGSKGDRLKEGCSINRSLFMLSHVISQLSEGQDQYVNFRGSKLTRILQSSLGGNAHTAIICAVTPASVVETSSTLGFASRALHIKNKPHVNEVLSDTALLKRYARQIIKLQAELEKTKYRNRTDEVEEIESKLQEQQRHNEFLQQRIDLLKEKLIGSAATDSVEMNRRRAFRRRTWCGHASRKSSLQIIPALETIDEGAACLSPVLEQDCISSSIQELAENTFFETPLEEFELQLMDAQERLSQDMESPEQQPYITICRNKSHHVTFEDQVKSPESHIKQTVDICSQTDVLLMNFQLTNSLESNFHETPPQILRERIRYYQNEYDELRKFTVLEKQTYNAGCDKELTQLEMENRQLQKSINDLKTVILDVNCINSELQVENKSLKERLVKESEKCNNGLISHLQPLDDVERELSQRTEETVALKKQLHFATQRMKELENEKNDLDMARELAEANLKRRNEELTCSLEDAWMDLKEKDKHIAVLKQNTKDLKQMKEEIEEVMKTGPNSQKLERIQEELKSVTENILMYIDQMNVTDECLGLLEQENHGMLKKPIEGMGCVKVANLKHIDELKEKSIMVEEEMNFFKEQNSMYIKQAKEKDECLATLEQQTRDLNSASEPNWNGLDETEGNSVRIQEQSNFLREENSMCMKHLKEKGNYLETLNQQIKELNCAKEANLKYIDELKTSNISVQEEIHSLKEENFIYVEELKEKDNCLEKLNQQIKELNCAKEANLKYLDELKMNNISVQEEIDFLKEENTMYVEQLKEKDNCLEKLNQQIKDLISEKQDSLKDIDVLKNNSTSVQKEINSLKEENSMYIEQLKERDNYLETLTQQIKDLNCAKDANLKYIDELKMSSISLHEEINSLKEQNSLYTEHLNEMDNHLETPKQPTEDVNSVRATSLKYTDELKANRMRLQKEINFQAEENSLYLEQLHEKDNGLEAMNQQINDLNAVKETNLKYTEQLQKKDKCPKSLRHEYSEQSQLYEVLAKQVTHYNKECIKRSLSEKSYEIESCRQMMLKEVRDLKPNYDVESLRKCQLTELLKILLAFVMEKEAEMFHMLQKQMNEIHTQTSESEKEYDDKDRHKDCCVRELEAEVKKSEVVTEPAENLVLKKQLEETLEKQRELAKENENLAIHITGLREEVNKLVTEITNLTKSINILVAEKHGINVPVCIEDCEIEDLKRQQDRCLHEKTTLVADCKCMQEQQDVICSEHEHRSPIIKKESCLESLHSGSQLLSVGVADSMTQDCRMEVSEEENLKEQLEICMEQKIALDDENEQLVTRIRGLENMLGIYCMDNDSLQKSNEALEEDMKKLVLELSVSHKNLLDAESEIQELKLKTIAVRKTEDLEAEVENLQIRNKLLLQENQSASNNISELCALNNQLRAQLAERTDVPKVSVATNTAISGPCHCKELTEKVHELKLINVQRNNRIGILELQIKAEEFPYQQKAKELEDSVSYYKNKNMELRTDLRRLHHMIKEKDSSENCDSCRKRKSLKSHHVAVQTDEVKDEYFLMAGGGGSGIIREDQLMKMRIKIYELESKNEMLKELCRERRRRILGLEEKLMAECRPCNIEERGSDSKEFQGVEKQSNGAGPSNDVEPIQSKGFNSGQVSVQAGNKEKSLNIRENLQRPRQNMYNIGYTCNTRRPLKENVERAIDDLGGFSKN